MKQIKQKQNETITPALTQMVLSAINKSVLERDLIDMGMYQKIQGKIKGGKHCQPEHPFT